MHDPMISRRGVTRQLELDKPIIAAINGDAIGLAATHALLSDITVMAEDARIGDTHVSRVGLVAGDGGTVIWPLLIGINKAKEFLIRGTLLSGKEAERIGLVNHVVDRAEVLAKAREIAVELANGPTWAINGSISGPMRVTITAMKARAKGISPASRSNSPRMSRSSFSRSRLSACIARSS